MNFWIIFAVCGLFAIPCVVMFATCGATRKIQINGAIVCVIFWFVVSGAMWAQNTVNEENWNGGYCECGAHWELEAVTRTRNGSETKYYACPECFAEIEINH